MIPPQLLILADDLTGAADTAGYFARSGFRTLVRFAPGRAPAAEVLALATHSRHLPPGEAGQAQVHALEEVGERADLGWVYKKIDSTLRGNPVAELQAILGALGCDRALVAPAFPPQGRTTVGGRQLVEGLPLEQTAFGGCSDLLHLFAGLGPPVRHLGLAAVRDEGLALRLRGPGIWVGDAQSEQDLACLARASAAAGLRLWCGSAGLARALREGMSPAAGPQEAPAIQASGPVLVVAGSRHPFTLGQVQALGQAGGLVLGLEGAAGGRAEEALAAGRVVVLTSAGLETGDPEAVAAALASWARRVLGCGKAGGLALTGGDTALAVCAALGSTGLWLHGEVEPGIPWGVLADGPWAGLPVATKAGGFGGGASLVQVAAQLGKTR